MEDEVVDELYDEGYDTKIVTPINSLQYIQMISQDYQFDKETRIIVGL